MGSLVGSLGSVAGTALGGAVGGPMGAKIGGTLGGALGGAVSGGSKVLGGMAGAQMTREQAEALAAAQREGRGLTAEAAKFRPIGFSTRFGAADYEIDPETGALVSAGYNIDPALVAQQEQLMGLMPGMLSQAAQAGQQYGDLAQQYFGMGQEALGAVQLDPMQAAQERYARLEAIQAPGRAEAQERLLSGLAAKGLTGLATETGTGARVNPYALAQQEAIARQQAQTSAES